MEKKNVSYIPRTKLLDMAISSITKRLNLFKQNFPDGLFETDFDTDFNIGGKTWKRIQDGDSLTFEVGPYKLDKTTIPSGFANFILEYDTARQKLKDIYIQL